MIEKDGFNNSNNHGHFEILDFGESGVFGFCSQCGEATKMQYMTTMPYYCQWCGAKMDEEVSE